MKNLKEILLFIRPNSSFVWSVEEPTLDDVVWLDENTTKPTQQEFDTGVIEYNQHLEQTKYRHLRFGDYPSITDQLDALWKGGEAAEEMLAKIQAVKAKYPKPE